MDWGQDAHPPQTEALFPDLCLSRLTQGPGKTKPASEWRLHEVHVYLLCTLRSPERKPRNERAKHEATVPLAERPSHPHGSAS